jgi:type II secretory pathway pseudopilin PulG
VGADLWGLHISNLSLGAIYVAGLATGFAALLGLVVLFGGIRRTRRLRQERKALARENARLSQHAGAGPQPEAAGRPGGPAADGPDRRPDNPDRREAPSDNQTRYDSPPPPSYDRSAIEAEADRHRAADEDYAAARADTTAPTDAPRTSPQP